MTKNIQVVSSELAVQLKQQGHDLSQQVVIIIDVIYIVVIIIVAI